MERIGKRSPGRLKTPEYRALLDYAADRGLEIAYEFHAAATLLPRDLFDRHPEYRDRYNRHFWARGYYCETVGNVNEATIVKYIA